MMIMAQHPQQQQQQQQQQPQPQHSPLKRLIQPLQPASDFQTQSKLSAATNSQQEQQDGKRTLIKNQLYLIEQLQLENANLRNERDQLQLDNEELKFQLQMISSSNILNQPGATFNNQRLEPLVERNVKLDENHLHQDNPPANLRARRSVTPSALAHANTAVTGNQVKLLATPVSQPMKLGTDSVQQVPSALESLPIREPITSTVEAPDNVMLTNVTLANSFSPENSTPAYQLSAFNPDLKLNLSQDDEEQRVKLVEQIYGDGERVRAAAIVIQRAFRKHQICKRFRTITEQLRLAHQSSERRRDGPKSAAINQSAFTCFPSDVATRTTAIESLSYAASRLNANSTITRPLNKPTKPLDCQQVAQLNNATHQARQAKQDPVVAAAINFQQLESIRKRQYRVGLNIFNKNPEKGISFLFAHSFIDSSSPCTKTSISYYHSNQLHFIDKQLLIQHEALPNNSESCLLCFEDDNLKRNIAHFLLHRKGLAKEKIGEYLGNLQSQFNQDVLKYYLQELDFSTLQVDSALRKFLSTFRLPGEAQKIEKIVDSFAQRYVCCQQQQISNTNSTQIHLQTQIEQNQQHRQNGLKNNLILLSKDEIFILTFAIIMLNTDLHSPSLKPTSRMSASQFVNNLRGVFKSQSIHESDLIGIYERVKANQITTTPDHVTHVMKVQQGLTVTNFQRKELPNLCTPHRRLVCFCRLFQVYDVNKKERAGQHQREIFLFNDLLLITKLARRVRANTVQLYTYRQSISLQGLYVQLFQSNHYNYGIRLCQRSTDETIIMFNARNELDQSRFVDDLGESIAEMDEMETIKAHNIVESIHFKFLDRFRRHIELHNINENFRIPNGGADDRTNKVINSINDCDNRSANTKQLRAHEDNKQREGSTSNIKPSQAGRVPCKFNSMLNLTNIVNIGDVDDSNGCQNKNKQQTNKQLFVQQNQRIVLPSASKEQVSSSQRRCSTSSVHSLDSGLFLSRDVSPNQSS